MSTIGIHIDPTRDFKPDLTAPAAEALLANVLRAVAQDRQRPRASTSGYVISDAAPTPAVVAHDEGAAIAIDAASLAAATGANTTAICIGAKTPAMAVAQGTDADATTQAADAMSICQGNGTGSYALGARSMALAAGHFVKAIAHAVRGCAVVSGQRSKAMACGDYAHAVAVQGSDCIAEAHGVDSLAANFTRHGVVRSGASGWIILARYGAPHSETGYASIAQIRAAQVGGPEGIKPHTHYRLTEQGDFLEVYVADK